MGVKERGKGLGKRMRKRKKKKKNLLQSGSILEHRLKLLNVWQYIVKLKDIMQSVFIASVFLKTDRDLICLFAELL